EGCPDLRLRSIVRHSDPGDGAAMADPLRHAPARPIIPAREVERRTLVLEMRKTPRGEWRVTVRCCWCETPCRQPREWQVLCDGRVEPAIVCSEGCAVELRAGDPGRA